MSDQITGYSVAGVIEADPNNEFVWVKYDEAVAAVALREEELNAEWAAAMDAAVAAARAEGERLVLEAEHRMEATETMQLGLAYIKGQRDAEDAEPLWPSEQRAYDRGQRDAFGGLSEEEYQRRIIVKNFDAGVKAARVLVGHDPRRYRRGGEAMSDIPHDDQRESTKAAVTAAEQRTRKQAARDLREWIFNTYPSIKGYSDIYVEAALDVVEGKP
jgi:hypothetical protein